MFIYELFEAANQQEIRLVVVYPGRFQPFHQGHAGVFAKLQGKFGRNNCFIATTPNVKIDDRNPFNATEKVALMHAAGITNDRIQLITEPYRIEVVTSSIGFDPQNTILIFAVGAPDKDRLEVDQTYTQYTPKPLKDGSRRLSKIPDGKVVGDAKPMKTFPGKLQDCVTVAQGHAYVVVVDEIAVNFEFNGEVRDISHGTQCRNTWNDVRNDPAASKSFLTTLYGRATPELVHIFDKIAPPAGELPGPETKPTKLPKPAAPAGGIDKIAQQAKKANKLVKEGVGVVKDGNDPRYSMATMGLGNDVNGHTLDKEFAAFYPTAAPRTQQKLVTGAVGRGEKLK